MSHGIAGMVPGQRLASLVIEETSDTFTTTETAVGSIRFPVVEGHTYSIVFNGSFQSTDATAQMLAALVYVDPSDLDGTSNIIQQYNVVFPTTTPTTAFGFPVQMETDFEAPWTGEVEIRVTGDRVGGSGDLSLVASPAQTALLYAEYVGVI